MKVSSYFESNAAASWRQLVSIMKEKVHSLQKEVGHNGSWDKAIISEKIIHFASVQLRIYASWSI